MELEIPGNPPEGKNYTQIFERLLQAHTQPQKGNDIIVQDLGDVRTFDDQFSRANPLYQAQIEWLRTNTPLSIEADTVGAYLFGCFATSNVVEVACTPECVSGISNPNLPPCELVAYHKRDHKLIRLNNKTTEDANIFIQTGQYLTSEDHAQLFLDGVRVITIFHQQDATINYKLGKSMVVVPTNVSTLTEAEPISTPTTTTETQEWWWWALVAVILVFFIIIAVIF
jgi:hypothetical protein